MRVCTYPECAEWCTAHGYPTRQIEFRIVGPDPDLSEPDFRFTGFSIPEDAGRRVALVKNLVSLLDEGAELLVQIGDWAVWPSSQHMPLFARFREAFGERRPLIEAPGHVIPASDRDDAVSIVVLSVLYLWDCHVPDGVEAFRRRPARRVLSDHASEVFVNRCPKCNRVVRTPKAQQCLWCGQDWHSRPASHRMRVP